MPASRLLRLAMVVAWMALVTACAPVRKTTLYDELGGRAGVDAIVDDVLQIYADDPRVHFVMAYGGNGITYSTIAAAMVRDAIRGKRHPLDALFGFGRLAG